MIATLTGVIAERQGKQVRELSADVEAAERLRPDPPPRPPTVP